MSQVGLSILSYGQTYTTLLGEIKIEQKRCVLPRDCALVIYKFCRDSFRLIEVTGVKGPSKIRFRLSSRPMAMRGGGEGAAESRD